MALTMTDTINYSGMLYSKVDESTRLLDAVYSRGKNGGRVTTNSLEFVLSSGYDMDTPSQPSISETASLTAPAPETTERTQEYNVVQIYQRAVEVSFMKQTNFDMLGGVNNANQVNNTPNELDFQVGRRVSQMRMDLNWSIINGVYQYTKGSTTVAPRSRGLIEAITTNKFDASAADLNKKIINDAIMNSIKSGANPASMEIWVNPDMLDVITDAYALIPGSALPATRTEGGIAYSRILTPYGELAISWDMNIPTKTIMLLDMGALAIAEKPYYNDRGEMIGVLFYVPLGLKGASDSGMLYGELGLDYGAEWHHAIITNLK